MPAYLTQDEIDALDADALAELEANGGYTRVSRPSIADLELQTAGRQVPSPGYVGYPMQGTSTWTSGEEAARRLGIEYDPDALYERPWAPGEYGIPLEDLYNQLIRDQMTQGLTDQAMAERELESAGIQQPRRVNMGANTGIPYNPAVQALTSGYRPELQQQPYSPASIAATQPIQPWAQTPLGAMPPGGGFGLSDIPGLAPAGGMALSALDAPRQFVGVPYLGAAVNALRSPSALDIAALGAGPLGPLTAPIPRMLTDYGGSKATGEQIRERAYGISPGAGVGFDILTDPLTYVAPGALAKVGTRLPALKPVTALAEGLGPKGALPYATGAALGTELASRTDTPFIPEPVERFAGGALGGMAGLGARAVLTGGIKPPVLKAVGDESVSHETFPRAELPEQVRADLAAAQTKMLDYARAEAALRRQGVPQSEIAAGRSRQAEGIVREVGQATAEGLTPEQVAQRAREGLATGPLRETVTPKMEFSPGETHAIFADLNDQLRNGILRPFEYWNRVRALEAVVAGEGLQPAQVRLVRRMFGDELADLVADRPLTLRQTLERRWRELTTPSAPSGRGMAPSPLLMDEIAKLQKASPLEREIAGRYLTKMQERIDKARTAQETKAAARQQAALEREAARAGEQMRADAPRLWSARAAEEPFVPMEREGWLELLPGGQTEELARLYADATGRSFYEDVRTLGGRKQVDEWIDTFFTKSVRLGGEEGARAPFGPIAERSLGPESANVRELKAMAAEPDVRGYTKEVLARQRTETQQREALRRFGSIPLASRNVEDIPSGITPAKREQLARAIDRAKAREARRAEQQAAREQRGLKGQPTTDQFGIAQKTPENYLLKQRWREIATDEAQAAEARAREIIDPVERQIAAEALATAEAGFMRREIEPLIREYRKDFPDWGEVESTVRAKINELPDADMRAAAHAALNTWQRDTAYMLAGMGDGAAGALTKTLALATGDVADSYLAQVLRSTANLENALEKMDFPREFAREIADGMTSYEVARKYGRAVPEHITEMLKSTRPTTGGVTGLVQEIKNFQFGVADVAVVGQQGLKAFVTGGPAVLAGVINRTLSAMGLPDLAAYDRNVSRSVAYALDGVRQGTSTGMTDFEYGRSILGRLPGFEEIDRRLMRVAEKVNGVQFGWFLTGLRNLNYEGNLMLARAAGLDINNPVVRARAAAFANANTSLGALAQKAGRRQGEAALALSPSMRRAQVQQILRVAQGVGDLRNLKDPVKRTNAVLSAMTLASFGITTMALGKFLHDHFGAPGTDFEFDPSKPGWGYITLGSGRVVSLFPQEQVLKTIARSLRAVSEEDWNELGETWIKFGLSTQSPVVALVSAAAGYGYDPDTGYRLGDLGEGRSFGETAMRLAPLPPVLGEIARGGDISPSWLGVEVAGVPTFPEGAGGELARRYKTETGRDYWEDIQSTDRDISQRVKEWEKSTPELADLSSRSLSESAARGSEAAQAMVNSQQLRTERVAQQEVDDRAVAAGSLAPEQWRENRKTRLAASRAEQEVVFSQIKEKPERDAVDAYYKAVEKAQMPNGVDVDWEAVDRWLASRSSSEQALIDKWVGTGGTQKEQEYRAAVKRIEASGYFEIRDNVAAEMAPDLRRAGLPIPVGVDTGPGLEAAIRGQLIEEVRKEGYAPNSAEGLMLIDRGRGHYLEYYDKAVAYMLKVNRLNDPALLRDLIEWGYYPGSKDALRILMTTP